MRTLISTLIAAAAFATSVAAADPEVLDPAAASPEGPVWLDGDLYYAEYGAGAVSRIDGSGTKSSIWHGPDCGPSAVLPVGDELLVLCYDEGIVMALDRDGLATGSWDDDTDGAPIPGPNDAVPDGAGGAWITASGAWEAGPDAGRLYHLGSDGLLVKVAEDLSHPNGVALSPDGSRLFVAESGTSRILSFAISGGTVTDRRVFLNISRADPESGPGAWPDGLEIGPAGRLWIGQYSSGRLLGVNTETATVEAVVEVPSAAAPNLAFTPDGARMAVMAVDDTSAAPWPGRVFLLSAP